MKVYKLIDHKSKNYEEYYNLARKWDKKKMCFVCEDDISLKSLTCKNESELLMFDNDNYIGYGSVKYFDDEEKSMDICLVIRPNYRKKGYGKKFLEELISYGIDKYNPNIIRVDILKKNLLSITLAENSDFDFDHFDDDIIEFKKVLKKEE